MHDFGWLAMKRAALAVSVIACASCIVLWLWMRPPKKLAFQVPAGFSGPFVLVEDPVGGRPVGEWGRLDVTVPPSGIVRVQSFDFLTKEWASIAAVRPDGTVFPFDDQTGRVQPSQVALRGGRFLRESVGGKDVATFEFYVGKADQDFPFDFQSLRRRHVAEPTQQPE